ncbi:multiple monosaccharide ABC transporter permease [Micromonospora sp. 4G57]|uniref:Xylose transport system permease protein XylH n=1 Tax=Micromonospora sicca TaxID=2202420 RepID=A0ABU5JPV1_9ACTN|nr:MULTISPECIES: multiple monosaccharide ABC transporter permease [unclassified Micromonospora]MDZ5447680.1 multiple monosaccharide ABC transporter permease [Micromonospora sp. 4G57]MDZ5494399.1 multiple monosaccharide ABC transporter permease [Micromonospora sp. 4G53]
MSSVAPTSGQIPTNTTVAVDPDLTPPPTNTPRSRSSVDLRQSGIYIAFAAIIVLFEVLTQGALLEPQNISNIVVQNSYILILAIGMILIIIAGHIDLSAGSVVAVTGAVAAVLMVNQHVSWPLAIVITLVVGALIGAWQGFWIAYFGIPAFIVTLAGMLVFRALTLTVLGNQGIGPFPDNVRTLANGFTPGFLGNVGLGVLGGADLFSLIVGVLAVAGIFGVQWRARRARIGYRQAVDPLPIFALKLAGAALVLMFIIVQIARFKNLPWVLVLLAVLVLAYTLISQRTVFGRHIYAVGGNLQAASLSGVKVKSVTFWIFVNMGVLAAIAGIIFAGRLNQAGPTAGNSFELDAIAAAFIGGAAVQGGVGKVAGAITGGLIMAVINNGMSLIGSPSERVMLVKGLVLLGAVAFDVWSKRRAGRTR